MSGGMYTKALCLEFFNPSTAPLVYEHHATCSPRGWSNAQLADRCASIPECAGDDGLRWSCSRHIPNAILRCAGDVYQNALYCAPAKNAAMCRRL
mmetsp:Transcript_24003/g.82076  ORF Transcript_24003/g.82076 Transcript_24003/m.82076 type:complete len:95 (-) Transcript_24003:106-390(-)